MAMQFAANNMNISHEFDSVATKWMNELTIMSLSK